MSIIKGGNVIPGETALDDGGHAAVGQLRVASAVIDAETVTIGADVYEVDTEVVSNITAGHIRLDLSGGGTRVAKGTITSANTGAMTAGDTVTIAGKVYTFRATITGASVDGDVLEATDGDTCITNLVAAVNLAAGAGVTYATAMTAPANRVSAVKSGHTVIVSAVQGGVAGNAFTLATTAAKLSVDAAVLGTTQSGVDPTAGEFTTALTAAINASGTVKVTAVRQSANEVAVFASTGVGNSVVRTGVDATATTETLAGANNAWGSATLVSGTAETPLAYARIIRVPTTQEVAIGNMHIWLPFTPTRVTVGVRTTSTGVPVVWNGAVTVTAGHVVIDNTGATDWSTAETLTVICSE